jgi:DNA-binding PadR family transcriptional regulator
MISKKNRFILFTLGMLYDELNRRLKNRYLRIAISKSVFIRLVQDAHITQKKARALYKNLETLEKQRYIEYRNQNLRMTPKGEKMFVLIRKEQEPYMNLFSILKRKDIGKFSRKSQTIFKL